MVTIFDYEMKRREKDGRDHVINRSLMSPLTSQQLPL